MLKPLRHHRWLAALALFASPAIGGVTLPAVHPCPMTAEVMAAGAHHGGDDHRAPGHHQEQCTCIGQCHAPSVAEVRVAVPTVAITIVGPAAPVVSGRQAHPPAPFRIIERHPPPTAPPLV